MPSSRGRQTVTPVIVEVTPSDTGRSTTTPSSAPSSPASPSKKARFAEAPVDSITRELSKPEAWSLYHFECHARQCHECYDPYGAMKKGSKLCTTGRGLASDVAEHVYYRHGEIYAKVSDSRTTVRVELPQGYDRVRGLLKAIDRTSKSKARTVPIISYEPLSPVVSRRQPSPERKERPKERRPKEEEEKRTVIIEPADSRRPHRKSSHKQKRYSTVVVDDNVQVEPSRQPEVKEESRKGSLYEAEIERQKKYMKPRIEIREPTARRREDDRRRKEYYYP